MTVITIKPPAVYHERQVGNLCALHTINNILQDDIFTEQDLRTIAKHLDKEENTLMESNNTESSENMDRTGNFSIQVITAALGLCNLEVISFHSSDPRAVAARQRSYDEQAFICHYKNHWFALRKVDSIWFNLDSLLPYPDEIDNDGTNLVCFSSTELIREFTGLFVVVGDFSEEGIIGNEPTTIITNNPTLEVNESNKRGSGENDESREKEDENWITQATKYTIHFLQKTVENVLLPWW